MGNNPEIWVDESPREMIEGDQITFKVLMKGVTSGSAPSATVTRHNADGSTTDITATVMPSGSHSVADDSNTDYVFVILKQLVALSGDGGLKYVILVGVTDQDSDIQHKKCEIHIIDPEGLME